MKIGKNISSRRNELGMSVDELASKIGKSRATIYRYENGDIENMPVSIIEPLAKALKIDPLILLDIEDNNDFTVQDLSPAKKEAMDKLLACNDRMCDRVSAYIDVLNDRELTEDISKFKHNDNF